MPKTIIHVSQPAIRRNIRAAEPEPVLTVKRGRTNRYAHEVEIKGPSRVVYRPDKPLSCGARVWVEVEDGVEVVLHGEGPVPGRRGHTDAQGRRKANAPAGWPFGTVDPPTARQQRDAVLAGAEDAPL